MISTAFDAGGRCRRLAIQRPWSELLAIDRTAVLYLQLGSHHSASLCGSQAAILAALLAESWQPFIPLLGLRSYCRPTSPPWGHRTEVMHRALLAAEFQLRAILACRKIPCRQDQWTGGHWRCQWTVPESATERLVD